MPLTRLDRGVLALVLLLLLLAFVVPRVLLLMDPVADTRTRAEIDLLAGPASGLRALWTDAHDVPLPVLYPYSVPRRDAAPLTSRVVADGQLDVVYQSDPPLPRDRWGNRWYLVASLRAESGALLSGPKIYSAGPNGRFE